MDKYRLRIEISEGTKVYTFETVDAAKEKAKAVMENLEKQGKEVEIATIETIGFEEPCELYFYSFDTKTWS